MKVIEYQGQHYVSIYVPENKRKIATYLLQVRTGTTKQWQALAQIFNLEMTPSPTVNNCILVRQYSIEKESLVYFFCFSNELSKEAIEAEAQRLKIEESQLVYL